MSLTRSLAVLLLPGCTYIGAAHYERVLANLDEDGDGAKNVDDCDDEDAAVFPTAEDLPYDGLDSNCDGQDVLDVDRDGYPGISEADWEALGSPIPYPPNLVAKPVDGDDTSILVFPDPTGTIEVPYDGVDADCQRDNDFDRDGDGWMPTAVEIEGVEVGSAQALAQYLERWGIAAEEAAAWAPAGYPLPQPGDCDDDDPEAHPEAPGEDVPYDGVDLNCDDRNDFDQDGDCFMPAAAFPLFPAYAEQYYPDGVYPFCVDLVLPDCLDEPDDSLVALDGGAVLPETVHPSTQLNPAVEVPYDGVDSDCGQDNDFDADQDGFLPDTLGPDPLAVMNAYAEQWGYEDLVDGWGLVNPDAGLTTPAVGDCDDADGASWPGALELLGDGLDQDCAGDPDLARFAFGDGTSLFTWTGATNPEVARVGDVFLVLVGANTAYIPALTEEFGVGLPFSLGTARGGPAPEGAFFPYWKSPFATLPIQPGLLDAEMDPFPEDDDGDGALDPEVRTASVSDNPGINYTYVDVGGIQLNTSTATLLSAGGTKGPLPTPYLANGVDVVFDGAGEPFALACATDRIVATYSMDTPPVVNTVTPDGGQTCFFSGAPAQVGGDWEAPFTTCAAGVCEDWTTDDAATILPVGASGESWVWGDQDDGWAMAIDGAGQAWVGPLGQPLEAVLPGETVAHLDVDEVGGLVYVAAVVTTGGAPEVWIAWGALGDPFDHQVLPFDDPNVDGELPTWVGLWADADRVALAVTATPADSVGWVFLGPVP